MEDRDVTHQEIARLARRELTAEEVLRVARHLETCAECRAAAQGSPEARLAGGVFDFDDLEHPDAETELVAYVDGALPPARREEIAAHIAACARCREDVDDLLPAPRRMWPRWVPAVAAVLAAAAVIAIVLLLRAPAPRVETPAPRRPAPIASNPEWDAAVRDALAHGIARPAILGEMRPGADALRGKTKSDGEAVLRPAGDVIDAAQPRLTWTPFAGARYVVIISDGNRVVASSAPLASASWTPPSPLPRATTLTWQVEVRRKGRTEIIPAPPRPPAMFRIIDDATARNLADAARRHPGDHLLLGVLYARAGLQEQAERELQATSSAGAARLLDQIRRW